MNKEDIIKQIHELKSHSKRKFTQSYDLVINLKNIVTKSSPVDFFVTLPHSSGKVVKTACFANNQLHDSAVKNCDLVLEESDFAKYSDKKVGRKLAQDYTYFIAQATLMPKVAAAFGKALGIRGKMPNPKLGCVVPPNANLEPLVAKLKNTVRLQSRKATNLQCIVGKESQPDEEVAANIIVVYNLALKNLPNEIQNVKSVQLKLTMGKPVKL
jgi:large subunit ribosomal protein L1